MNTWQPNSPGKDRPRRSLRRAHGSSGHPPWVGLSGPVGSVRAEPSPNEPFGAPLGPSSIPSIEPFGTAGPPLPRRGPNAIFEEPARPKGEPLE